MCPLQAAPILSSRLTSLRGAAPMKILIIDDDKDLGTEVVTILKRNGHEAEHVATAREGIPRVESADLDFVLVDYQMPEYDGLWFMKNVRLPLQTKVLLVTSHADREKINNMFHAGISGYVIKPFDEEELLRHLAFHSEARTGASVEEST